MKKLIYITVIITLIVMSISTIVFAGDIDTGKLKQIYDGNSGGLNTIAGKILGIIQVVGTSVALIVLIVLGTKYILASPGGKAEYKKTLVGYVIGAVVLFAASNILGLVKIFVDGSLNS